MKETAYILVDDSAIANALHLNLFERIGIDGNTHVFQEAQEALDFIRQVASFRQVLVFLDINMPLMNGWQFMEELEKEDTAVLENVIVIMLTSSLERVDRQRAETFPLVVDYIVKPLQIDNLWRMIEKHVNNRQRPAIYWKRRNEDGSLR